MTDKEDFFTGTKSAAFGGTTTILDMPNTKPPVTNLLAIREKLDLVKSKANIDFGLFGQLGDIDDIPGLARFAIGFKLYMSDTTGAQAITKSLEHLLNSDHLAGKVVTVHAEDPRMFEGKDNSNLHRHNQVRSIKAEFMALKRILSIETPVKLNLAHLTTLESADLARANKSTYEVTPHHLLLHDASKIGTFGKVNPPLRKRSLMNRLFDDLATGRAIIASDHAPHTLEEKEVDFENAPSGLPGVETRVPLMMALAKKGILKHSAVQDMCCTLPAELFNLRKGKIEVGYDADLAFFDLDNMVEIDSEKLHSKCGWTPFEGHDAIFPAGVMLRGKMIVRGGELAIEKTGEFLK